MKKNCAVCGEEFEENPFIYCDNCMDLITEVEKWNKKQKNKWIYTEDLQKIIKKR